VAARAGSLVGAVGLRVAVAAAAVAVTLGVLETGLRLLSPQDLRRDEGLFSADPRRAFRLTPGFRGVEVSSEFRVAVAINAQGLRDRELAAVKPPGTRRLLVLGDSFTYGSGVAAEETYPERLEALLRAHPDGPVEVINAGVSGYATFHQAAFLRDEGWAWEPDALVLQIFLDNDLTENLDPFRLEVRGGHLQFRADRPPGALDHVKAWVRRRSHAHRFLGDRYHLARIRLGLEPFYAAAVGAYARTPSPEVARGWALTRTHIRAIVEAARARGVPLLAIHAPKAAALDDAQWERLAAFHRAAPADLDRDRPGRRLRELFSETGTPFLDLAPLLRATGRPLDFYYPHNGHWNAAGHGQIAEWLAQAVERERVLRPRRPTPQAPASR
jgi:lysophospholipase L1-like esterase